MVTEDSDKMFYQMEKIKNDKEHMSLIWIMQTICLLKITVKKMIDKCLYKLFEGIDNLMNKLGVFLNRECKALESYSKRKRKKSS